MQNLENNKVESNVILECVNQANSPAAKHSLEIADEIADLIYFHARCRENGDQMMQPWEEQSDMDEKQLDSAKNFSRNH